MQINVIWQNARFAIFFSGRPVWAVLQPCLEPFQNKDTEHDSTELIPLLFLI